ncbi:hypothetical protein [uncultured Polaribacter sp.]|uniref:hypothetical protein n=1 Tax=uncultured Polaribacter sp. TaxID=174711 RepID=UPI00262082D0|nr:hypothetical protein [uncultured Polaribacter sp.]
MKTLNGFSLLFIFLMIVVSSCKTECNHHEHIKIDNSRPSNAITYNEMARMFHQYDIGQKKVLDAYRKRFSNGKDSIETIAHFYEIHQLKQYIAYLEKLSKEKDIELTGIQIFSAAYPENYKLDTTLSGRQSLIFMPTANINGKNTAYEPLYSKKGQPIPFTKFLNKFSSRETKQVMRASFFSFFSENEDELESSGTNRLKPSPPM